MIFYGALLAFTLWATWRDVDLRWVAFALFASWAMSNFIWHYGTPHDRPGVYTMAEMLVACAAYIAGRSSICAIAVVSVCANVAFASIINPNVGHIRLYEQLTNCFFMLECLLAIRAGLSDVHFFGWFGVRGVAAQSHADRP